MAAPSEGMEKAWRKQRQQQQQRHWPTMVPSSFPYRERYIKHLDDHIESAVKVLSHRVPHTRTHHINDAPAGGRASVRPALHHGHTRSQKTLTGYPNPILFHSIINIVTSFRCLWTELNQCAAYRGHGHGHGRTHICMAVAHAHARRSFAHRERAIGNIL